MINIQVGGPQTSVELNARKTLDGNLLIMDHDDIDIVVLPQENKILSFPKEASIDDTYNTQNRLFDFFFGGCSSRVNSG